MVSPSFAQTNQGLLGVAARGKEGTELAGIQVRRLAGKGGVKI